MIWAALGTLMPTSLRSGYDLFRDICPDHRYMRRPLPISSSCPSVPRIQYTVLCYWFKFWNSISFSSNELSWHYYSNGEASSAELIALSAKAIEQIIIRMDKKDRIVSRPVWNILSKIDRMDRAHALADLLPRLKRPNRLKNDPATLLATFRRPLYAKHDH